MAGGAGVLLVCALFVLGLAAKERDNRFCVACHLHDEKFERLTGAASTDLAGFHHAKDAAVGCIACHGGADTPMRLVVSAVAAIDTVKFFAGAYEEPTRMKLQLRDAECRQCHTPIIRRDSAGAGALESNDAAAIAAEAETEGRASTAYHAIREHDTVRVACTACHASHTTGSDVASRFISKTAVVPICRECHKEM